MPPRNNNNNSSAAAAASSGNNNNNNSNNNNNMDPRQMGVNQLVELATHAQDTGHVEAACEFYDIALAKMPHHIDVLEAYAEVLLHYKNEPDRARQMLQHAVEVNPDEGYIKYLSLAQLSNGAEALKLYESAVNILKREMVNAKKAKKKRLLFEASTATVAAAELFLTDLCDEENAERRCELLIQEALGYSPTNIEAMQALGSLRLSQQRPDEARSALLESVRLTKQAPEALQPSFDSKVELARLLIQVDLKSASNYLLMLLNVDDTAAISWFLLAEVARLRKKFVDAARLFRRSRIVAEHCGQEQALDEIDSGIRALVTDMGGDTESLNTIPDIDHPDPISLLSFGINETSADGEENDDASATSKNNNSGDSDAALGGNSSSRNNNSNENKKLGNDGEQRVGGEGGDEDDDEDDEIEEPEAFPHDEEMNWENADDEDDNNAK